MTLDKQTDIHLKKSDCMIHQMTIGQPSKPVNHADYPTRRQVRNSIL